MPPQKGWSTIFDVITVGSNVIDTFVRTDPTASDLVSIKHGKRQAEELVAYPLGSKILISNLEFQVGGGGTNTAVALARMGLSVGYLGKIGKDENGLKVFKNLKEEGVTFIGTLGEQNGYSVILDSVGDDRTILTFKGCNNELTYKEIKKNRLQAKAYYLCSMIGQSLKTLASIAKKAKKDKALVAFNPSSYLTKNGLKEIKPILDNTDILILNDEEAGDLAGFGTLKELAKRLSKEGPSTVVITRGEQGAFAYHKKKYYDVAPTKNLAIHETTGAGDAFGSTLLGALLHKKTFPQALKLAMINAESVITHYGAKNLLLRQSTLEQKLKKDKRTIKQTT